MDSVRPAAVAGAFYPANPSELAAGIAELLRSARNSSADTPAPKVLIAPHAGYIYSGRTAASAYARLASAANRIKRVVLLGPAHRVAVQGLALPGTSSFQTPLGQVRIDAQAVAQLAQLRQVVTSPQAHALEHSLEVHLPFLQTVLEDFSLVPLVVGSATPEQVAQVLELLWGGDETLIVISSDLSHYLSYEQAQRIDRGTARAILSRQPDLTHYQACGATPVNCWPAGRTVKRATVS